MKNEQTQPKTKNDSSKASLNQWESTSFRKLTCLQKKSKRKCVPRLAGVKFNFSM